jgi:hypothetical protein
MSAIFRAYNDWLADPRNARRVAVRGLPHGSHPIEGHCDDQPGRRPGRDQGAGARRPPGPLRHDDHRVSARAPALRRVRVRAVLGRRRRDRPAAEPAHGDAAAGQDLRGRRQDAARHEQSRDEGVLSGIVDVRSSPASSSVTRVSHWLSSSSSWRRRPTCSPPWTTDTASATARRFTASRTACSRATSSAATSC